MPNTRWPVVLFDLDGTLADNLPLVIAGYQYAWSAVMGEDPDWHEVRQVFATSRLDSLRESVPADKAVAMLDLYREFLADNVSTLCRPLEGITSLVRVLAANDITLGVATSLPRSIATTVLESVGLSIPVLASFEDVKHLKPEPDIILTALAKIGATPAQTVYVGDSIHDIKAAKAAGAASVAVTWGAALRADLAAAEPDALIDSPSELAELVLAD